MSDAFPRLVVSEEGSKADRAVVLAKLAAFEEAAAGPLDIKPLDVLIKDAGGATVGGLIGRTLFRWLIVELLFVPAEYRGRGLGADIMARAEAIARERGCLGIWLDTFSFQAPGFYEKLGFERFGQVDGHPPGAARVFLQKRLHP